MNSEALQIIGSANLRLAAHLAEARRCLRGEGDFGAENVREMSALLSDMEPIVKTSAELRETQPALGAFLDKYKSHLQELDTLLVQIRVALEQQRLSLGASREQNQAVTRWASAFQQTR